ncbi:hypothetical protein F3K43_02350 [Streptomyces sp. LBUM 1476]|nr:hypothetical protein [Streptomyces sp. LBUM 1476]GAQ51035.1 putative nicotinate-nucleotide pyrophosphorylase [Streptomyces acidiscabies]GAV45383.1 putative nicotinate-nucleotide pyrophosphorylase [Streptomyces acidiscabies]
MRCGMARTGQTVKVDVEMREAAEALDAGARWPLLDNMPLAGIEQVVRIRAGRPDAPRKLPEAPGTVRLNRAHTIAETGIALIPVGASTHSAPALDLTMLPTTGPVPA